MRSKSRFTTLVLLEARRAIFRSVCNRAVRFAATVARGHATFATRRALILTQIGLPLAGGPFGRRHRVPIQRRLTLKRASMATAITLHTHISYTNEHTSLISGRGRRSKKPAGSP